CSLTVLPPSQRDALPLLDALPICEADVQAAFGGALDFALDGRAHRMLLGEFFPRIALGLLEAEADAALVGIDFQHHHIDFLAGRDRQSTRLNSSHVQTSYAVFCSK